MKIKIATFVPSTLHAWFSYKTQNSHAEPPSKATEAENGYITCPRSRNQQELGNLCKEDQSCDLLLNPGPSSSFHPPSPETDCCLCVIFTNQGRILLRYLFVFAQTSVFCFILSYLGAFGPSMLFGHYSTHLWLAAFPVPSVAISNPCHVPRVPLSSLVTQG